jgi:hypothetical protein
MLHQVNNTMIQMINQDRDQDQDTPIQQINQTMIAGQETKPTTIITIQDLINPI